MKKVVAFFLIAVVAMVVVFAEPNYKDTLTITVTREAETDIGFYESSEAVVKLGKIEWDDIGEDQPVATKDCWLKMKTNEPKAFQIRIFATGMTRDTDPNDIVPLNIAYDGETHIFKSTADGIDPTTGTSNSDVEGNAIVFGRGAVNGMDDTFSKQLTISADFANASAGSYTGYVTVEASSI